MSELGTILEREGESVDLLPGGFERLLRRRDRRRRNQRLAAAALAVVVAIAAVGAVVTAFRSSGRQPATPPPFSRRVPGLHLLFTGAAGSPASAPAVGDGSIFVGSAIPGGKSGSLVALPARCSAECQPRWTADVGGWIATPGVGDGVVVAVRVGGAGGHPDVMAFATGCGSGGATCHPLWTADIGGVQNPKLAPVVADGIAYIGGRSGDRLFAFALDCRADGGACSPLWTGRVTAAPASLAIGPDAVYVGTFERREHGEGTVAAFPIECSGSCVPSWTRRFPGAIIGLSTAGDHLFVGSNAGLKGTGPGLYEFSRRECAERPGACEPLWTADREGDVIRAIEVGGRVFVQDFAGMSVYPSDCRSDGGVCDPIWSYRPADGLAQGEVPVVRDDVVFVGNRSGSALALPVACSDPCTSVLWQGDAGAGDVAISFAGDAVLAAGDDGLSVFGLPAPKPAPGSAGSGAGAAWFYGIVAAIAAAALVVRTVRRRT